MKQSLLAGVLISTLGTATLVQATPAQAFVLDINPITAFSSNSPATGASGTLEFNFQQVDLDTVRLLLTVTNTTGSTNYPGDTNATQSRLVGVAFDLPSLIASYTFTQYNNTAFPLRRLFGNQTLTSQTVQGAATLNPFSNNPPTDYPGGGFDIGIRSAGTGGTFNGGNPNGGLSAGQSTTIDFLLNGFSNITTNQIEGRFYYGFLNVDGNGSIQNDQLRAALRFQAVNGTGADSDKLLAKPEAVPTPALLPALLAVGLGAIRKKKQSEQDA